MQRVAALAIWAYLVWLVLTWTATAEQFLFGAGIALAVAFALAPMGPVIRPWQLLNPRRLWYAGRLLVTCCRRIVAANVRLAYRIWAPNRPLRSGMVIVPTTARSAGSLTAVGLLTSVIVDNQIIDLDPSRHALQYHAVAVPEGDPEDKREVINAPVERLLAPLEGRND